MAAGAEFGVETVFPKTRFGNTELVLGNTVLLLVDTGKGSVSTTFIWKNPLTYTMRLVGHTGVVHDRLRGVNTVLSAAHQGPPL